MTVSKEDLLKQHFGIQELDLPGVGQVKIRPLTRSEALQFKDKEMPIEEMERKLVSMAMVEPKLTQDEVAIWQDNSAAGELEIVTQAITKLSGMEANSAKEAYKSV